MDLPFSAKVAREGSALVIQREPLARLPDLVEKRLSSQKCFPRSSCVRTATSDADLEAEARLFRGQSQMSSLLGGGGCPQEGGGGCLPSLP